MHESDGTSRHKYIRTLIKWAVMGTYQNAVNQEVVVVMKYLQACQPGHIEI